MVKEATAFYNQEYNLRESEDGGEKEGCQNPGKGIFQQQVPQRHKKGFEGPMSSLKHLALHLLTDQANSENR